MQTSDPTPHGYVMALPPAVQGSPVGDFFNALLRGLTHKQNNFLAVIQGFSSLILMSPEDLEQSVKENLEHMKEAAQGAAGLAERIMMAGGSVRLNLQKVNLKEFLPLMDAKVRAPFVKFNVPFTLSIDEQLPLIAVDGGRFCDLLCDVLLNAAEAAAAGPKPGACDLHVFAPGKVPESRPGCVDVFVRNTGTTIAPDKLKDVFQPFKSTKDSKHFGIGLTIAAMLLQQMGGSIGVKSENEMTTFWISVPVAQ